MTIYIFILKGDFNGENRSGAFLFLSGIVIVGFYQNIIGFFYLMPYNPSAIFQLYRDGSSWVEPVLS